MGRPINKIRQTPLTPDMDRVRESLDYDRATGVLAWKRNVGTIKAGQIAGCRNALGYIVIRLDRQLYLAHRLAWMLAYGRWPAREIDHVNGDPADNRLENLREASHAENQKNMRMHKDNAAGVKGICFVNGFWVAQICTDGQRIVLGRFKSRAEAVRAYAGAAKKRHGRFARL